MSCILLSMLPPPTTAPVRVSYVWGFVPTYCGCVENDDSHWNFYFLNNFFNTTLFWLKFCFFFPRLYFIIRSSLITTFLSIHFYIAISISISISISLYIYIYTHEYSYRYFVFTWLFSSKGTWSN